MGRYRCRPPRSARRPSFSPLLNRLAHLLVLVWLPLETAAGPVKSSWDIKGKFEHKRELRHHSLPHHTTPSASQLLLTLFPTPCPDQHHRRKVHTQSRRVRQGLFQRPWLHQLRSAPPPRHRQRLLYPRHQRTQPIRHRSRTRKVVLRVARREHPHVRRLSLRVRSVRPYDRLSLPAPSPPSLSFVRKKPP